MAAKEKKEAKKVKEEKKVTKSKKETSKEKKVKKESFLKSWFKEVISEFKKVRWPNKKEMIEYSIATIVFILFFGLFFYAIELIMYFLSQYK